MRAGGPASAKRPNPPTGATSAIEAANKTLSDLMMSGTMLGSGLGMTVTALIVGLAVGAGVTALVLKKKSSKAS